MRTLQGERLHSQAGSFITACSDVACHHSGQTGDLWRRASPTLLWSVHVTLTTERKEV